MERRTFLQAVMLSGLGGIFSSARCRAAAGGPPLSRSLLAQRNQNRSTVIAQHGMVCTAVPLASMVGIDVLKAGGNAIDAVIAANIMLSLVEPMSCGPGGDLFAIIWSEKDRKLFGLNASGRAPYDWSLKQALDLGLKEIPPYNPLSWSVPGCVSGWEAMHKRFGKLPFARLLEPAIRHAREGFPLSPIVAGGWVSPKSSDRPGLKATYLPDGQPVHYGTIFKNPGLASLFETLAKEGPQSFYQGEPAERIVKFSQAQGGRFALRDFRDHKADWVEPVSTNYRGYDVWEIPPNGQGIATLQILNLMEHFEVKSMQPNSAEYLHLFLEAKKLAFEDRAVYYADMDYAKVPLRELISKEYAAERV